MAIMVEPLIFHNLHANSFTCAPLLCDSSVTHCQDVRYGKLFLKDESNRAGLPSFKILGASWGAFRALVSRLDLPVDTDLVELAQAAQNEQLILHAATDGNHGRAVARMASIIGIPAVIYVPVRFVAESTIQAIKTEGARVYPSQLDYDATVMEAYTICKQDPTSKIVFVQDTSFPGYREIPMWIVDGYSMMLFEIEQQLQNSGWKATHIVVPVGVGSLAHAVVTYCKSAGRQIAVIAVEPVTAACLHHALVSDEPIPIKTGRTIMEGMNCGTVSDISWPVLRNGVDTSLTVTEQDCHSAIEQLSNQCIKTGPCGAATYAGYVKLLRTMCEHFQTDQGSVVVLLATEGPRAYHTPI